MAIAINVHGKHLLTKFVNDIGYVMMSFLAQLLSLFHGGVGSGWYRLKEGGMIGSYILVTFMTKVMFRCLVHLLLSQIVATTHPSHLLAI